MSTVRAVADTVNGILTEDALTNPQLIMGYPKASRTVYFYRMIYKEKVYILRPCMIHGR
jgi:hypothetical protein